MTRMQQSTALALALTVVLAGFGVAGAYDRASITNIVVNPHSYASQQQELQDPAEKKPSFWRRLNPMNLFRKAHVEPQPFENPAAYSMTDPPAQHMAQPMAQPQPRPMEMETPEPAPMADPQPEPES